jgi:hypothetical protein
MEATVAEFWQFVATAGITVAGVAGGVWAVIRIFGEKLGSFYLDKAIATHKHALQTQAETHKSELRTQEDAAKQVLGYQFQTQLANLKAEADRNSQALAEMQKLAGQKELARLQSDMSAEKDLRTFEHEFKVEEVKHALQARRDDMTAQRTYLDMMQRAGVDLKSTELVAISDKRLPAYQKLWSIMKPLSPRSKEPLNQETRTRLENDFSNWFFDGGDGLFLTWQALDEYIFATGLLSNPKADDEIVRSAFSGLRTQMKIDLSVYTQGEAEGQIGQPRHSVVREGTNSTPLETDANVEPDQSPLSPDQRLDVPKETQPAPVIGGTSSFAIIHPVRRDA